MEKQRDEGIFGALIVKEKKEVQRRLEEALRKLNGFWFIQNDQIEDFPGQNTLSVTDHMEASNGASKLQCMPDKSRLPQKNKEIASFEINGVKLHKNVHKIFHQVGIMQKFTERLSRGGQHFFLQLAFQEACKTHAKLNFVKEYKL